MKIGIVGFPGSGKTTLFGLLTGADATAARRGSRGDLHVGVARVPDERLQRLGALFAPQRLVLATVDVVDVAGFERGEREELDIADLRNADALLHVVRAFSSPSLGAPPDPIQEIEALDTELVLGDLEVVERRLSKLGPGLKRKATPAEQREEAVLTRLKPVLESGAPLRTQAIPIDELRILRGFGLLSLKPILHCLNLGESELGRREAMLHGVSRAAAQPGTMIGWVSAALEAEVAALAPEEQRSFLDELKLEEPALARVIRDAYALVGLVTFFTVGDDEVRGWAIPAGATALDAAATVHSDLARGFIRAEVIGWAELLEAGSLAEARRRGILRLEGKDYTVKDGEICHIRFNVSR
jgi:GTP-binding protein YchF